MATLETLDGRMNATEAAIADIYGKLDVYAVSLDTLLEILCGCLIMTMQAGFALLEVGSVKVANVYAILLNNVMDVCVGTAGYFFFGYAVAFGPTTGGYMGTAHFALTDLESDDALTWVFFQYSFAATATAIVSGAMVGRTSYHGYLIYSFVITGFVYPTVVHWTWSGNGWLNSDLYGLAFQDFAGSGVVHACGGTAALMGAMVLGRRKLAKDVEDHAISESAPALVTLGFFILMVGFFAFNGSSQGAMSSVGDSGAVARAVMNTGLACASGGLATILFERLVHKKINDYYVLCIVVNGCLGGTVAVCASANVVTNYGALIIGSSGAIIHCLWSISLHKFTPIEDPVDATAVHLAPGVWGVILCPFMDKEKGIFYCGYDGQSAAWHQLGVNIAGLVAIIAYTALITFCIFKILDKVKLLRSTQEKFEHAEAVRIHEELLAQQSHHGFFKDVFLVHHEPEPKKSVSSEISKMELFFQHSDSESDKQSGGSNEDDQQSGVRPSASDQQPSVVSSTDFIFH
ncbi:putative ammonium transporter sll1017 [Branchiostoma floridae]|uniref:Ammonium transporter sll1017 n=1 Tax=Branchiostoma floridae TaxID=7739 RepID=A0A9J7KWB0_BRAFL|nr:putative ammonium transporter sll1017 [Branchiostoma floridae]